MLKQKQKLLRNPDHEGDDVHLQVKVQQKGEVAELKDVEVAELKDVEVADVIKNDDLKKAKNCLCVGLVLSFGLIGGIISYFVLRKVDPKKAKIFLYIGIVLTAIGIAVDVIFGPQIMELDPGFGVNI